MTSPQCECLNPCIEHDHHCPLHGGFTAANFRAWIAKACRFDKDAAGCDDIKEDRYSLRDEGRNDDGSGESYTERNL